MENQIILAGDLAKWLIEKKGLNRLKAYIIASRKYKVPDRNLVRQRYLQIMAKQESLF